MRNLGEFLSKMPKVELHIHLEGSIPPESLWDLMKKYNGIDQVKNIEELKKKFIFTDFTHFIETWVWKNRFINEYDDFTFIASEAAKKLIEKNIKYVEMFYSPPDFMNKKLNPQKITEAVYEGITGHKDKITVNLVADLVRDFGPEKALHNLKEINEVKEFGVIGIGIGGSEHAFPPEQFKAVFEEARKMGFYTSAHAGEAAGAESIWGAVNELKVDRIGHGTRAYEDPALIEYLQANSIPIEMCPISNVRTGVVDSINNHPIKNYYDRGLVVFVNTDDPEMFNNTMVNEYEACVNSLGFNLDDVKQLANNAIQSAWCVEEKKSAMKSELNHYFESNKILNI